MIKQPKPDTAVIEIRVRVPRKATAAQMRSIFRNHWVGCEELWLDWPEIDALGSYTLHPRIGRVRIERKRHAKAKA
jgi:hypothetical protein